MKNFLGGLALGFVAILVVGLILLPIILAAIYSFAWLLLYLIIFPVVVGLAWCGIGW